MFARWSAGGGGPVGAPVARRKRSVLAHATADLAALNAAPLTSGGYTRQGRTSRFNTYYYNGLLNHAPGDIIQLTSYAGWRTTWSIIVAGKFGNRSFDDLLFYSSSEGVVEMYATEGGNISLLGSSSGWSGTWSMIVPCRLLGGPFFDLLFYDATSGVGEVYRSDGHGGLTVVAGHSGWRTTWQTILPCRITGSGHDDLAFHDPTAGDVEIYKTDGHGNISFVAANTGLPTTWSAIAPFEAPQYRVRAFGFAGYDATDGSLALYTVKHDGTMSLRKRHTGWSQTWSMMRSCAITGPGELMFYDRAAGVGEFYVIDRNFDPSLLFSNDDWRHTWEIITPANFTDGAGQDLLFYDRGAGQGELYVTRGNTLATALLPTCEADYGALREYFGTGSDDLPFDVKVRSGYDGAYHGGCDDSEIHVDAFDGNSADLVRMLLVSEADEVFEADIDNGWDCGESHGEGLSRVLAAHRYPQSMTYTAANGISYFFHSGSSWIWSSRDNWVDQNDGTDQNFVSIGCAALFIHYLKFQLGYSLEQITQADGDTLADKYAQLTGRTDAFAPFKRAIERRFDRTVQEDFDSDNAFPIYRDLLFYGAGTGEFYSTDINADLSLVHSDDTWRTSWFAIDRANFTSRSYDDLLFYERFSGTGQLYRTDGHGHIHQLALHTNWRTSWDIIIPARFGGKALRRDPLLRQRRRHRRDLHHRRPRKPAPAFQPHRLAHDVEDDPGWQLHSKPLPRPTVLRPTSLGDRDLHHRPGRKPLTRPKHP